MMKKFAGAHIGAVMALAVAGTVFLAGCKEQVTEKAPELVDAVGVDMDTAEVVRMDLSGVVSYSAQIVPKIDEISFLSSGSIDELKVSVGDHVKKGQLLATLSGNSGKAKQLREEINNLKAANEDVNKQSLYDIDMMEENLKSLRKKRKAVKKAGRKQMDRQITEVEENIKIAEEKLRQQKELQQLEIRQKERELSEEQGTQKNGKLYSPINGEIVGTTGGSGYMVQGGNTAFQVANMEAPRLKTVYISNAKLASASQYVAVVNGKQYEVELEEQELSREEIERSTHPANTWFDFVDTSVDAKVGISATLNLYTDAVENALVVPANAVFQSGEESYVYLVDGDAKTKVVVTTGTKTDAYVQIESGVKEGDIVYVEG